MRILYKYISSNQIVTLEKASQFKALMFRKEKVKYCISIKRISMLII